MKKILLSSLLFFMPIFAQQTPEVGLFSGENSYTPDALNRLYIVGLQYLTDGDLTQAEIAFRSIIAFPMTSDGWRVIRYYKGKAHYYLGDIYFIRKRYPLASSNYRTVAAEYTDVEEYSPAIFKLGRSLILEGRQKDGIEILRNYYINYGGKDGLADNSLFWIARGHLSTGENLNALKFLEQIISEYPNSALAYDVRILISQIKTENLPNSLFASESNTKNKEKTVDDKQELAERMNHILTLKERLLSLQERRLELLDKTSQRLKGALKSRQIYANPDSKTFQQ